MKASYRLPSGDYNIILSPDELQTLIQTGKVRAQRTALDMPCVTSRAHWDGKNQTMIRSEDQKISNRLCFNLRKPVEDCEPGIYNVQFLNIIVEEGD